MGILPREHTSTWAYREAVSLESSKISHILIVSCSGIPMANRQGSEGLNEYRDKYMVKYPHQPAGKRDSHFTPLRCKSFLGTYFIKAFPDKKSM